MYRPTSTDTWTGRALGQGGAMEHLWHHVVQLIDATNLSPTSGKNIALLGFCTDEGVRRNLGRVGSKDGPAAIRKAMCNLAVQFEESEFTIYDAGDVVCEGENLESATLECQQIVADLLTKGYFPVVLGGGHEISYAHMSGAKSARKGSIGIINLDAHFDLRTYENGPHSGSWARQLADEWKDFNYLPVGIHEAANNRALFQVMKTHKQSPILWKHIHGGILPSIHAQGAYFIEQVDHVCLTLDLDVISGAHAPGVSAPAAFGLSPERVMEIIEMVFASDKVISMDIAELNPVYDDGRTAKLVAMIVWNVTALLTR